jgi:hypothetical protein
MRALLAVVAAVVVCAHSATGWAGVSSDGGATTASPPQRSSSRSLPNLPHPPLPPTSPSLDDTYAIVLSGSRFYFNYRHSANAAAVYDSLRRLGVPDTRILLLLADEHACSARNPFPATLFHADGEREASVFPEDAEVDFAGMEVTPDAFLRAITGRVGGGAGGPNSFSDGGAASLRRRIAPTRSSNLLVYMTGHGGDGFLKFHDKEELSYADVAAALADAFALGRFGRAVLVADTCQAATVADAVGIVEDGGGEAGLAANSSSRGPVAEVVRAVRAALVLAGLGVRLGEEGGEDGESAERTAARLRAAEEGDVGNLAGTAEELHHAPHTVVVASSVRAQNSYAFGHDGDVGVSLSDGFTRAVHEALQAQYGHGQQHAPQSGAHARGGKGAGGSSGRWRDRLEAVVRGVAASGEGNGEGTGTGKGTGAAGTGGDGNGAQGRSSSSPSSSLRELCAGAGRAPPAARAALPPLPASLERACAHLSAGRAAAGDAEDAVHAAIAVAVASARGEGGGTGGSGGGDRGRAGRPPLDVALSSLLLIPDWRIGSRVVLRDGLGVPLGAEEEGRGALSTLGHEAEARVVVD